VFALEAFEIALFVVFWVVQTAENWGERVEDANWPESRASVEPHNDHA
jgi:hypothetical protein